MALSLSKPYMKREETACGPLADVSFCISCSKSLLTITSHLTVFHLDVVYGAGPVMSNSVLRSITRGYAMAAPPAAKQPVSMGIAAGGSITQQIDKDSQDPEIYDFKAGKRIYIHFINAGAWK